MVLHYGLCHYELQLKMGNISMHRFSTLKEGLTWAYSESVSIMAGSTAAGRQAGTRAAAERAHTLIHKQEAGSTLGMARVFQNLKAFPQ